MAPNIVGIAPPPGYAERVGLVIDAFPGRYNDLARLLGIPVGGNGAKVTLSRYRRGRRVVTNFDRLAALCAAVGVDAMLVLNGPTEAVQTALAGRPSTQDVSP